jgi:hypothetical protein
MLIASKDKELHTLIKNLAWFSFDYRYCVTEGYTNLLKIMWLPYRIGGGCTMMKTTLRT